MHFDSYICKYFKCKYICTSLKSATELLLLRLIALPLNSGGRNKQMLPLVWVCVLTILTCPLCSGHQIKHNFTVGGGGWTGVDHSQSFLLIFTSQPRFPGSASDGAQTLQHNWVDPTKKIFSSVSPTSSGLEKPNPGLWMMIVGGNSWDCMYLFKLQKVFV